MAAAIHLLASPGPNGPLARAHSALHGCRKTLYTIAVSALNSVAVIGWPLFDIAARRHTSLLWLSALKRSSGALLVYLGVQV